MSQPDVDTPHPTQQPPVGAVVILAAGEGTRMKSARSKLLHELGGHSMLSYAVDAATALQPERIVVVVGHLREQVEAHLAEIAPHVTIAVQGEEAYGTGYAVRCALDSVGEVHGEIVVTYGDVYQREGTYRPGNPLKEGDAPLPIGNEGVGTVTA